MALSDDQIKANLGQIPGWRYEEGHLKKIYQFADFKGSLAFVNQVGDLAETANHHPDILIEYSKVKLSLCTHDYEDSVTGKDFNLAEEIEKL